MKKLTQFLLIFFTSIGFVTPFMASASSISDEDKVALFMKAVSSLPTSGYLAVGTPVQQTFCGDAPTYQLGSIPIGDCVTLTGQLYENPQYQETILVCTAVGQTTFNIRLTCFNSSGVETPEFSGAIVKIFPGYQSPYMVSVEAGISGSVDDQNIPAIQWYSINDIVTGTIYVSPP